MAACQNPSAITLKNLLTYAPGVCGVYIYIYIYIYIYTKKPPKIPPMRQGYAATVPPPLLPSPGPP